MNLRLNQTPENFKEFYGRNEEQMPKLIAEGRVPISVARLMQRRLDIRNASDDVKSSWMDNHFGTGDAVVHHPDGRVKIVLDSQYLREMTPQTPNSDKNYGALVLTPEQYDTMAGEEFKEGELGEYSSLSRADVKANPLWRVLARDQVLLNDYTDLIFAKVNKEQVDVNVMRVYTLKDMELSTPQMRVLCVDSLNNGSNVDGGYYHGAGNDRFVGVGTYTIVDVQNVVSELEALEKIVRFEALGKVRSLVSKL